jgi:hypothetical protein
VSLVMAGQPMSPCNPVVARKVSGEGSDRRVSFIFSVPGGTPTLTFSGPLREVAGHPGETPVDQVSETWGPGHVRNYPASGACRMALPEILCGMVTERGQYAGRFLANPGPPRILPDAKQG